jgi:hypothetical protein
MVNSAVFEVVVEKAQTDQTVYEKELNWDMVPFAVRTDKYHSIGTAFAISETELITAFHVINLSQESVIYDRYFIRDSGGKVYEVDQVNAGSNERDFLVFTVKDRTFTEYFEFDRHYEVGLPVYSIGNALGEGIIIRNGLVLGTVPEEEAGRWNLLKSSADGNPGNSGGPLVTQEGKVAGLVVSLRDNILYSVPAEVILETRREALEFRTKLGAGHLILANSSNRTFTTQVTLPAPYKQVQADLVKAGDADYEAAMTRLFDDAPEYLTGPNNLYLLNASVSSTFPELEFVNRNDNNWYLSDLEVKSYTLPDDGRIAVASLNSFSIYKITRPRSTPLAQISEDPRFIMDMILGNIRTERTLWGNDKYRILSFGDPMGIEEYRDALGRSWIAAHWIIGFDDRVLLMYVLPLPNGPAVITCMQNSFRWREYTWDIQKVCDHVQTAYSATFEEWDDFIALDREIPPFLGNLNFDWQPANQEVSVESGGVSITMDNDVFDWNSGSELLLIPSWYRTPGSQNNETIEFGIRRMVFNRDIRGREYIVLYKNIKPDPKLGAAATENWNDLVQERYPFDENPGISAKDNTGSIGAILRAEEPNPEIKYSLYLSIENPGSEENLSRRFSALKEGTRVRR